MTEVEGQAGVDGVETQDLDLGARSPGGSYPAQIMS
jgi:hypothetical protein